MKKGTAISLPHGSDEEAAAMAVRNKYDEAIRSPKGWYGVAVVNIEADADGNNARKLLIKVVKNGFEVYGLIGHIEDKVQVKAGKFVPAS
jgi:hypothetical protein